MSNVKKPVLKNTLIGIAVGTAATRYLDQVNQKYPLRAPSQQLINLALDRTLGIARRKSKFSLDEDSRYIIFSDHHKGAGDEADDFLPCKKTYKAALDYYDEEGYTLILLGDVEELWENKIQEVIKQHEDVFQWEARFLPDRYIRIIGNHDNLWNDPTAVDKYLIPLCPGLRLRQGLVFEYDDGTLFGEFFLAHGHQGTLDSDILTGISPHLLPTYRRLQNKLHIGHTTPATNDCLRSKHDTKMYRWASQKRKLIFIAGHTHRPVWSSLTHLDQLYMELYALRLQKEELGEEEYLRQLKEQLHKINKRMIKEPPVDEIRKTAPCYFNTGCCRYSDGDITGIEITGETISLVKWDRNSLDRMEPVSMPIADLFALL